jgi:Uncharacterized protein conserved in bacteria (DUF2171)
VNSTFGAPPGGGAGEPDPVSWLQIAPGWQVVGSDGVPIGSVESVTGDKQDDIFDGLAVKVSDGGVRYVPGEQVGPIVEGTVTLRLASTDAGSLEPFQAPPQETVWRPPAPSWRQRLSRWLGR